MGGQRFTIVMARFSDPSRRTLLGAGLASGLATLLGGAAAGKKGKKKKKCKGCTTCQRCHKGRCKAKPEGAACDQGTCQEGTCSCAPATDDCPTGCECLAPAPGELPICIANSPNASAITCARCPAGTIRCILGPSDALCFPHCGE